VVVDPQTGILYETEDADAAGFFRFVPEGGLAAGRLQMLTLRERRNADTRRRQTVGRELKVEWVEVDEPDPDEGQPSCHRQGIHKGAAVFRRLEGAWWSPIDRAVYFTATDGGDAKAGQVWAYRPVPGDGTLTLVYESPSPDALFKPDNITVSPQGGLLVCEDPDGSRPCRLRGLSRDGKVFPFAEDVRTGPKSGERSRDEFTGKPAPIAWPSSTSRGWRSPSRTLQNGPSNHIEGVQVTARGPRVSGGGPAGYERRPETELGGFLAI
jgi:secreted PhoX family phosphatase